MKLFLDTQIFGVGATGPQGPKGDTGATGDAGDTYILLEDVACDASVFVKAAVRMNSSGVAVNAIGDSMANSNVIGFCIAKSSSVLCDILVSGITPGVFTGLDVTKGYYLSPTVAGEITDTPSYSTGDVSLRLGQPFSATEFFVHKEDRILKS